MTWPDLHPLDVLEGKRPPPRLRGRKPKVPDGLFERLSNANLCKMLDRACERAGIARCSCNDLRRTFATWMARDGVPILVLQKMMGHADTTMLATVYARVGRGEHVHRAIEALPTLGDANAAEGD